MLKTIVDFPGLYVFEPKIFHDGRGYFFESYNQKIFKTAEIKFDVVQENQSRSSYGTVRGLHYQGGEYPQAKFVRAVRGEILDVVVDLRVESPSYGKYFSIRLSEENKKGLFIPAGFAHGFSVLSEIAEVVYLCDAHYDSASEGGIRFDDTELAIDWMIELSVANVSDKDKQQQCLSSYKSEPKF
ncbi:dTDP-4-dehydrorhamnose 3,5-epimerase [Grimontia marina]|uniref:dTDP-4-dehydrorhamnose 3,5-epimerase n=1 Tax=Grimontia marina TaxID=646534 RepID=A0A128ERX6_9GAMM|nr:dTDP-4-dehydrorhamnose 3,5-epimerase [Grimontia marina]CZF77322.1 dTDP-4-dehydrorhamnose 3,5-epimerase [Grimontia marina]